MESLTFEFADRATVPGWLGRNVQKEIINHILEMQPDKVLLVTEERLDELHGSYFEPLAKQSALSQGEADFAGPLVDLRKKVMPPGDEAKSWDHLTELINWNFEIGATKKSVIVAFGGGALLNLTGLYASIAFRGMKLVYVPTTLLAMHDVVTSLKTSICHDGRKNNIGSFYAPLKILIDVAFCNTLPRSELMSGLGELAKNAAILGAEHAAGFVEALTQEPRSPTAAAGAAEFTLSEETTLTLVRLGIKAKMGVLKIDAYEKLSGMIFEYGHTTAHAIEKAYGDGVVPHGLAVTYGMLCCADAAVKMGLMTNEARKEHNKICHLLTKMWPLPEPRPSVEKIMARAMRDSKRGITGESPDEISDVLLHKVGDIYSKHPSNLTKFPSVWVAEWLASMDFPFASPAREALAKNTVTEEDCKVFLSTIQTATDEELKSIGYEVMTAGFVNRVCGLEFEGQRLIAKRYTDLVYLRNEREAIGVVDVQAGLFGCGPVVAFSGVTGLVEQRMEGTWLTEPDVHKGDYELLGKVGQRLAVLHQLEVPEATLGKPVLWRTIEKMMRVVVRKPESVPSGMPTVGSIVAEVSAAQDVVEKSKFPTVLCHGDFKPSNVIMTEDGPKFVDFELGGPNYRAFDIAKFFRTAEDTSSSRACRMHFLGAYLEGMSPKNTTPTDAELRTLADEVERFEPLTWLEAAIFFLTLPQYKPANVKRWNELAADRWEKYMATKSKLFEV